jgi:ribosomal protein S4
MARHRGPREKLTGREGVELFPRRAMPASLLADHDNLTGRVERLPERAEIDVPVSEQLIVELDSK